VPVDKSTASPAKANPFWKVASEKFVTCGLLVLLPPQPISARAKDAAPAKGIKRPRDLELNIFFLLLIYSYWRSNVNYL
jgi:hypothetical protein